MSEHNKHSEKEIHPQDDTQINDASSVNETNETKEPKVEEGEDNKIAQLESQIAEQKDKYIRLLAEFENYKRRTAKENTEIRQTAGKDIILSLLEVLDDVDRAEIQLEKESDVKNIKEGIELVFNKLKKNLHSKGLKEMESIHTEFDPELHEAITQIPSPSDELKGKVLDQVKKGYYLNDKLIRHAQVVVGQ